MTDNRESNVTLRYLVEQNELKKVIDANQKMRSDLVTLGGEAAKSSKSFKELEESAKGLERVRAIGNLIKQQSELAKQTGRTESAVDDLRDTLLKVGASDDEVLQAAQAFEILEQRARDAAEAAQAALQPTATTPSRSNDKGFLGGVSGEDGGRVGSALSAAGGLLNDLGIGGQVLTTLGQSFDLGDYLNRTGAGLGAVAGAALPAAAALGVVAVATEAYRKELERSKLSIQSALSSLEAYYNAISNGTSESIQSQIEALKVQKDIADQQVAAIKGAREAAFASAQQGFGGDLGARILTGAGDLTGAFSDLNDTQSALTKKSFELGGQIAGLERSLSTAQVAANDAAEAEKRLAEERRNAINQQIGLVEDRAEIDRRVLEIQKKGTLEQLDARLETLNADRVFYEQQLSALDGLAEKTPEVVQRINDLRQEIANIDYEILQLINDTPEIIKAREAEAKAISDLRDTISNAFGDIGNAVGDLASGADLFGDALGRARSAQRDYLEDVEQINERAAERRAAIEQNYADKLVDIARKAAQDAEDALRDLQREQADARRDFARGEVDAARDAAIERREIQIESAREEAKALREHADNLAEIRRNAQRREADLAFDRDFIGLFFARRDTSRQLEDANTDFFQSQRERGIGSGERQQEFQRQLEDERQQRIVAFQRNLEDAQIAYTRDLENARIARRRNEQEAQISRDRDFTNLRASTAREINLRAEARNRAIQLIGEETSYRLKADQTLVNSARNILSTLNVARTVGGALLGALRPKGRSDGGDVYPGGLYEVNEPWSSGRETLSSMGRTFGFSGPGLFLPFQSGNVNANRGGSGSDRPIQITIQESRTPEMTAQALKPMLIQVLRGETN
jgi:hypothetical protein